MAYRRMVLAMSYVQERQIARTPAEVWRIATDWQVAELWLGVSKLRPTKPREAPAVGSVLSYQVRGMLHPMTIFAWEPEAHLGLSTEQGGITASYEFRFESNADGTRVVRTAGCSGSNALWGAAAWCLEWVMRLSDTKQLEALDRLVRITSGSGK
jgi:uncharacterized protein YndB with AHSA1/START domain